MDGEERESPGATRSQHVVLQGPADVRMMAAAMRPGLERSRTGGSSGGTSASDAAPVCLVVTPTIEQALAAASQARTLLADDSLRVVPVSSVLRARRVLANGPVSVVVGIAADLLALRRESGLRLDTLQSVVIIGLDEILADGGLETLQALLGDAPGEIARVATLEVESPEIEAFLEAQLRRARRITPGTMSDAPLPMTPSFAITTAAGRSETLRQILDAVDPPSLVVVATSERAQAEATDALTRLGMTVDGAGVQVVAQPTAQHAALVVLWETPASSEALVQALASRPVDAITLLLPDELASFRRMSNGEAQAWTPPIRKDAAESRTRTLRTALRSTLANAGGASASEMALLAPLLDTHDALEIAAAALRLYEGARRDAVALRAKATAAVSLASARGSSSRGDASRGDNRGDLTLSSGGAGKQRVFLAVGKRDGARVGDIVGAVANEAGINGDQIGAVELFESHATVELSADDATKVVEALASATLRGRKLNARIDDRAGFPARGGAADRGPRGARPMRGGDRGDRRPRTDGPDRGDRGDRGDRPARPFDRSARPAPGGRDGGRDGAPREGGFRGPRPGGPGGLRGGGGRPPRADDEKRAFGDRPVQERTEGRQEWSERAARMNNARRTPRERPTEQNDEG